MATHTIIINDRSNKTKHLLGLIREMAKGEKNIEIDPIPYPNKVTLKAIADIENKKTHKAKDVSDLFEKLSK
jgi:hypothetical protein